MSLHSTHLTSNLFICFWNTLQQIHLSTQSLQSTRPNQSLMKPPSICIHTKKTIDSSPLNLLDSFHLHPGIVLWEINGNEENPTECGCLSLVISNCLRRSGTFRVRVRICVLPILCSCILCLATSFFHFISPDVVLAFVLLLASVFIFCPLSQPLLPLSGFVLPLVMTQKLKS